MPAPRFVSPGAMGGNAIEKFLVERELMQRKQQEEVFRQQQIQEQAQHQAAQLQLQQQQEQRVAAAQKLQEADMERQRGFQRASTIAQTALPGDVVDDPTASLLREQGFGSQMQQGQPTQGPLLGEDASGVPQYQVTPGVLQMRGGSQYMNAQAQREAATSTATANRTAADERAAADRATRESIAAAAAGGQAETRGLRNQLTQIQIDREKEKVDAATAAKQAKSDAAVQYGNEIASLVDELLDSSGNLKPELAHVVGPISGRTGAWTGDQQTALEKINRLVGLLDINKLREMKSQSATGASGFGALSEKELGILESAGSTLRNRLQGEGNYASELARIRSTVKGPGGSTKATAADLIRKYGGP